MESNAFLGTGWSFPPSFDYDLGGVVMVSGEEDIRQSLHILLFTGIKERNMHPDFGCELSGFLFEEINRSTITGIKELISHSILLYETRIELDEVEVSESDTEQGLLDISISYTIRATNTRSNMVFPFYLNEATNITQ
jgi:phage baseplate assembly protein W